MIQNAIYKGEYKILLTFEDGSKRLADFFNFISSCKLPFVKKYLDIDLFKTFYFNDWGLCWGDNEFDINPASIYNGDFEAQDSPYFEDIKKCKKMKV